MELEYLDLIPSYEESSAELLSLEVRPQRKLARMYSNLTKQQDLKEPLKEKTYRKKNVKYTV